jgi:hypothetical protein
MVTAEFKERLLRVVCLLPSPQRRHRAQRSQHTITSPDSEYPFEQRQLKRPATTSQEEGDFSLRQRVQSELNADAAGDVEPERPAGDNPHFRPAHQAITRCWGDRLQPGETVVLLCRHKRRPEVTELSEALL